jgi:nucleotide-binding universal stress UspA family protein
MNVLIPVDGSDNANRAVDYVVASLAWLKEPPHIHLLNVQWQLASANVKLLISQNTIDDYYREQGAAALSVARAKLDAAQLAYTYHLSVGTPAEAVVQYAKEHGIEQIVMSAHGEGTWSEFLLGSVTEKVARISSVPVLLIK